MTNSEKIYTVAKNSLGKDFSTDNNLGCAETINAIVKIALGYEVGGGASTAMMYEALKTSTRFKKVDSPQVGDIVLCPTGQGQYPHGHVGIVAKYGILSNNSASGTLQEYYTLESWRDYFVVKGGFPMLYYRACEPITSSTTDLETPPVEPKIAPTVAPVTVQGILSSKTIWLGAIITFLQSIPTDILPATYSHYLTVILGILVIANRFLTTSQLK